MLKYSVHINQLAAKAKRRSGLLFRYFVTRPLLEYASSIWSPTQAGLIDKVESVQRQFTKRIPALHELSYRDRFKSRIARTWSVTS